MEHSRDRRLASADDMSRKVTHGLRLMKVWEYIYQRGGVGSRPGSSCGVRTDFQTGIGSKSG